MSGFSLDFLKPGVWPEFPIGGKMVVPNTVVGTPIDNVVVADSLNLDVGDIDDIVVKVTEDNFFFQARYVLVTYKTWLDKDMIIKYFVEAHKAKFVRVAHEIGTKKIDYEHSHVFVDFGKHVQRTNCHCFDYANIHPNIGPIRFQKHLNRIYKYMCKYDHANDDMLNLINKEWCVLDVWECRTIQEALLNATKAVEISAIIQCWNLKPRDRYKAKNWIHPWQQDWHDRVMGGEGNYRSIDWIWESCGNTGKSYWAKEMFKRYPKEIYVLKQMGGAEKCATIIQNALSSGWTGHCLIIDLPRNAEDKSIYEPLESIRDGMVTAVRYQGQTMCFDIAWVVVLANFTPNTFSMSQDRWRIHDHNRITTEGVDRSDKIAACFEILDIVDKLAGRSTPDEATQVAYFEAYNYLRQEGCIQSDPEEPEDEETASDAIHAMMQPQKSTR